MANKKTLDELIREVLNENFTVKISKYGDLKGIGTQKKLKKTSNPRTKNAWRTIAGHDGDSTSIKQTDYDASYYKGASKPVAEQAWIVLKTIYDKKPASQKVIRTLINSYLVQDSSFKITSKNDVLERNKELIKFLAQDKAQTLSDLNFQEAVYLYYQSLPSGRKSRERRDFLDYLNRLFGIKNFTFKPSGKQALSTLFTSGSKSTTPDSFNAKSNKEKFAFLKKITSKLKIDLDTAVKGFLGTLGLGATGVAVSKFGPETLPTFYDKKKLVDFDSTSDLAKIARLREDTDRLEIEDLEAALGDPQHPQHGKVVNYIKRFQILTQKGAFGDYDNTLKDKIAEFIGLALKTREKGADTIIGKDSPLPQVPVKGVYGSIYGGKTPTLLIRMFETVAGIDTSIDKRLANLREYVNNIGDEDYMKGQGMEFAISAGFVLNYLRDIITSYESSAAGFLFENFLALLFSGTKEGLNVQIEDFTFGPNAASLGSAKLYRSNAAYIDGSTENTLALLDRGINEITYIVALKSEDFDNIKVYVLPLTLSKGSKGKLVIKNRSGKPINVNYNMEIKMSSVISSSNEYQISLLTTVQNQDKFNKDITTSLNFAQNGIADVFKK